ncbi:hypothetical protein CJ030_MR1G004496 [Morella rubra]|uniref:F-box domain-containing protein n=1 Tax=Morella rubra TaxID=262757 RepID=A0A6A1WYW4_9ROSI|nr:hypothetical protein CJ030_MR1G004496 [Morella rubra]
MERSEIHELVPTLPEELGFECLTRLPFSVHRAASRVCRRWRELLQSEEFYHHRKKSEYTHKVACLVQAIPGVPASFGERKRSEFPIYGITIFDPADGGTWDRLEPIPKYPDGLPPFCQMVGCEGKLVVMGGWDPLTYSPINDVFVYDFTTSRWRRGADMPWKRSFFAIGAFEGRVYVGGGHDENKNASSSAWVYNLRRDEWTELRRMSQERDECEGVVIGDEFWVVSGYATESQGAFEGSAEVYKFGSCGWIRVDDAWEPGRCPRSCVGVGKDGKFTNWAESDSAVRVGTCGVMLGPRTLVTGSAYQGAPQGFYMVEMDKEGQNGKLTRISVPDDFSGFVQSGCCVEI